MDVHDTLRRAGVECPDGTFGLFLLFPLFVFLVRPVLRFIVDLIVGPIVGQRIPRNLLFVGSIVSQRIPWNFFFFFVTLSLRFLFRRRFWRIENVLIEQSQFCLVFMQDINATQYQYCRQLPGGNGCGYRMARIIFRIALLHAGFDPQQSTAPLTFHSSFASPPIAEFDG
jgi:hypothetical protein